MRTGLWQTDNPDYGKSSQNPAYWDRAIKLGSKPLNDPLSLEIQGCPCGGF